MKLMSSRRSFARIYSSVFSSRSPPHSSRFSPHAARLNASAPLDSSALWKTQLKQITYRREKSNFVTPRNAESESATVVDLAEKFLDFQILNAPEKVETEDFLVVLRHLATSDLPDAPLRAERWLQRLEQNNEHNNPTMSSALIPTTECYQRVIEAWAASKTEDPARAMTRSERWISKLKESSLPTLSLDTACLNAFLNVCTTGRVLKGSKGGKNLVREYAQVAEKTLRFMIAQRTIEGPDSNVAPTLESFNFAIRGWTRCRTMSDVLDRTTVVFDLFENYHRNVDSSVRPDSKSYAMLMDAISLRARMKVKRCLRDSRSDESLNGLEEIVLLENIIEFLEEKYISGDKTIGPATATYNTLLACWANLSPLHPQATVNAEVVLRKMISQSDTRYGIRPNVFSYCSVIKTWKSSKKPLKGQRVTWILAKMWKDFEFSGDPSMCPTTEIYNLVLQTWLSQENPAEAEKIFLELLEQESASPSGKLRANSESYAILIRAWLVVASKGSDVALRNAFVWIQKVHKLESNRTGISSAIENYGGFLAAARKCASHNPDALRLASEAFELLRQSHHTIDCLDFSRLLQVGLLSLSKPEKNLDRALFVENILHDCKEAGLVSSPLIRALANGPVYYNGWTINASRDVVSEAFPVLPLPAAWTRNLKQEGMTPKPSDFQRCDFNVLQVHGVDPYENQY